MDGGGVFSGTKSGIGYKGVGWLKKRHARGVALIILVKNKSRNCSGNHRKKCPVREIVTDGRCMAGTATNATDREIRSRASGSGGAASGERAGGLARKGDGEHAVGELGAHGFVIETVADAERELVVALGAFEMEGGPVDAHEVRFPGGDNEVGAAKGYLDSGGFNAGDIDDDLQGIRLLRAIVVRIPKVIGSNMDAAVSSGFERMDDRVHIRGYVGSSLREGRAFFRRLNWVR